MINKKLGYYIVNGIEFDSKIKASIYAQSTNSDVHWIFNNNVFEKYQWNIEPIDTLDDLYDRRTKQLRDTYDYIIVSYSGGSDSHNIVESFLRQNLHIDELIINTMEKGNKPFTKINPLVKDAKNAAAEHYFQTLPRLKEISKKSPKTKITILDMTDYLFNDWLKAGDASWILDKREGLNPLNVTRFNYIHFNETRKQFDKSKKIGLILGVEKPRTFIHTNGKFYIRFTDRACNIITIENYIKDYDNTVVEYFYWAPESVNILCKQAHVIKKWLELNTEKQQYWFHKNMTADLYRIMHERELRPLLYSTWNNSWWQADKATLDWYSEFDSWWIEGYKDTKQHAVWREGIDYVKKHASKFVNNTHGFEDGLVVHGYNYCVSEMNSKIDTTKLLWNK